MTCRVPCSPAPGLLEDYAAQFDALLPNVAQRRANRAYLQGLLLPRGLRQNSDFSCPNRGCWGLKWGFMPIIRPSRSAEGPHCSKIVVLVGKEKT